MTTFNSDFLGIMKLGEKVSRGVVVKTAERIASTLVFLVNDQSLIINHRVIVPILDNEAFVRKQVVRRAQGGPC